MKAEIHGDVLTGAAKACRTSNRKITRGRHAYVTMASQASCPLSCPLLGAGCYAEAGPQGIHTARLNKASGTPEAIARAEAEAIASLPDDAQAVCLRLHVVGDCVTAEAASTVAEAAEAWAVRNDATAYGYTHAWRDVPREAWRSVSILASVETMAEAREAIEAGYAPAIVVAEHTEKRARVVDSVRVIPCPNQTRDVTCDECRLCFNAEALHKRRAVIAFEAHGARARVIRDTLKARDA
mgnify:CR=1 FL=1